MSQNNDPNVKFLIGERVYLRPIEPEDLPLVRRWVNDPEVRGLTASVLPMSRAGANEWLESAQADKERVWFVVVLKEGDRVIGEAGLLRMYPAWRISDITMIIGDREAWGQGYGPEAIVLLMDYAFGCLNLHRLSIGVVGFNTHALRFWEGVGFRREGVQRDGYYYDHAYHDFIMMGILEDEFRALYKGKA